MMNQYVALLSLFSLFVVVVAAGQISRGDTTYCKLDFHDCGSVEGKLMNVSFNGSCSEGKAILQKGTVVSIDFDFSPNAVESVLTSKVHGKIGVLPFVNFPLKNPDACKDSGLTCPINKDQEVNYLPVLEILTTYPSVNVIVKWELQDKDEKDVFCVLIPAIIS